MNTIAERTEEIYPHEIHVYRRRWEQLQPVPRRVLPQLAQISQWRRTSSMKLAEEPRCPTAEARAKCPGKEWRAMLMPDPDPQDRPVQDNW